MTITVVPKNKVMTVNVTKVVARVFWRVANVFCVVAKWFLECSG